LHVRNSEIISGSAGHLGTMSQPSHLQLPYNMEIGHQVSDAYAGPASGYSNLVSMTHTPSNINTIHTVQQPENTEFEMMKQEKNVLNSKLDDF